MNKPNIIYVFTDQHRRHAMGFWSKPQYKKYVRGVNDPVHTPNFDKFADESVVFTQAVSNCPLCSPYRAMLMSGRFPENNGVKINCKAGRTSCLKEDIKCITDVLSEEGYNVGYIGKLHLDMPKPYFDKEGNYVGESGEFYSDGSKKGQTTCWDMITPKGPRRHSVDYWYSYGAFNQHKNPHYWDNDCVKHEPKELSAKHDADKAIDYINNVNRVRDDRKPYCLFVSMNLPHSPYSSKKDTDEDMFDTYYSEKVVPNVNELLNRPNVKVDTPAQNSVRYYFSHVSGIDKQFGRILDAIDNSGKKDNTIVVFAADHGDMMGSHGLMGKNVPYEESFLIPFILRYPNKLNHKIEDLMLSGPDVMPTLLSLADMKDKIPNDVDGTDYSPILVDQNKNKVDKPKSVLFIHDYPNYQRKGVRTNRYTLSIERNSEGEFVKDVLFDNVNDPYQLNNLNLDYIDKETLYFLRTELGKWLKKANDLWYKDRVFKDFIIYPD